MSKRNYTEHKWDEPVGYAQCFIHYNGQVFEGTALCHKDDIEYKSQIFGETLAEARATRKYLAWIRDNETLPQLKALNQLYYSMKHSTHFNPKSYEAKMLFRQIRQKEEDINCIKITLTDLHETERMLIKSTERIKRLRDRKPE